MDFDLISEAQQVMLPTQSEIDEIRDITLSAIGDGVKVTDFVNSIILSGDVAPTYFQRLLDPKVRDVPISKFKHFANSVAVLSVLRDGISLWQAADTFFATMSLMLGLNMDLAAIRLTHLETSLDIDDPALRDAFQHLWNEISLVDEDFWGEWYFAFLQNRSEMIDVYLAHANVATSLMQLGGFLGGKYGSAIIFGIRTWQMTKAHRDRLREATLAATIFHALDDADMPADHYYLRAYALKIHLRDRREAVTNWSTWVLSWFSGSWRDLRDHYQDTFSYYVGSLYLYRIQILENESTPLRADFRSSNTTGVFPLQVAYEDQSMPANRIVSWKWDLTGDDRINSEERNPTFTYSMPGTYDVALTVNDGFQDVRIVKPEFVSVGDPSSGRDVSVRSIQASRTHIFPGDAFQLSGAVENHGDRAEPNIRLLFRLIDADGVLVDEQTEHLAVDAGGFSSILTRTLRAPHNAGHGAYTAQLRAVVEHDANPSNNFRNLTIHVGDLPEYTHYRTQFGGLIRRGDTGEIGSYNVHVVALGMFTGCVPGESTQAARVNVSRPGYESGTTIICRDDVALFDGNQFALIYRAFFEPDEGAFDFGNPADYLSIEPNRLMLDAGSVGYYCIGSA